MKINQKKKKELHIKKDLLKLNFFFLEELEKKSESVQVKKNKITI